MKWQLLTKAGVAAVWSQCSSTSESGPCFTAAKTWTDAQKECEKHSSNLATVLDAATNNNLGANGCFTDMPWNDWKCTWIGATDLAVEGTFEWPSGQPFSFNAWGEYAPVSVTCEMEQHCAALCKGGNIDGYSGNFWIDLKCTWELAFCCDEATFVNDGGTPERDSFIENLEEQAPVWCPEVPDPTRLGWEDAQAMCENVGSHLLVIESQDELDVFSKYLNFTKVPKSWGLNWQCVWIGMHDRNTEGYYEWTGPIRPTFTPPFGPFEGPNGDGTEDCVALCQSSCEHGDDSCTDSSTAFPPYDYTSGTDLSEFGYTGNWLMDADCSVELGYFCQWQRPVVCNTTFQISTANDAKKTKCDAGKVVIDGMCHNASTPKMCNKDSTEQKAVCCVDPECACTGGEPVDELCERPGEQRCKRCLPTHILTNTKLCEPRCACDHGTPDTGCSFVGEEKCKACDLGYALGQKKDCLPLECACTGGKPVDALCKRPGEQRCERCLPAYLLTNTKLCEPRCACDHGTPDTGCSFVGEEKCKACDLGYDLVQEKKCQAVQCLCSNGSPASSCSRAGGQACANCDDGFTLNNSQCVEAPCYIPGSNRRPSWNCTCLIYGEIRWDGDTPVGECSDGFEEASDAISAGSTLAILLLTFVLNGHFPFYMHSRSSSR